MVYPIFSGADKNAIAAYEARRRYELMKLIEGTAGRTIYLNGGSDTRRGVREYYQELAAELGIGFQRLGGWGVLIGGPRDV